MVLNFNLRVIPHSKQRYETVGDYEFKNNQWDITVSSMDNPDYVFLVMIHELIELYLTQKKDILEEDISKFDIEFEKLREEYPKLIGSMECGDMTSAPYFEEHQFATKIEKLVAEGLGVDWNEYDKIVSEL